MTTTAPRLLLVHLWAPAVVVTAIGVNYGTVANNLPSPQEVANFLKTETTIDSVKIFDVNADIIRAFANTGIAVTVAVPNGDILSLTEMRNARRWVSDHIAPFHPQTKILYVLVGSEVLHWGTNDQILNLVPAMRSLHAALVKAGINDIKQQMGLIWAEGCASLGSAAPLRCLAMLLKTLFWNMEKRETELLPAIIPPQYCYCSSSPSIVVAVNVGIGRGLCILQV